MFREPFPDVRSRYEREPQSSLGNAEIAVRFYRRLQDFDISLYAYRGFWRTPGMKADSPSSPTYIRIFYPELSVYGVSAQGSAGGGILSFETGYYHSRADRDGDDPAIPNSQIRFLVGYQRQIWQNFTFGIQYYGEVMEDHGAYLRSVSAGFPAQEQYRDMITLRLEHLFRHQTLRLSLFSFYSPVDNDYLIQPQSSYEFTDFLSATLGANIFGGENKTTALARFDKNDNLYLSIRFDF